MLKLYYSPGACSLASHIALEEAKAPYAIQRVDLKAGEQRSPEYLKVNPKGRVPALATDRGVLTEIPVILVSVRRVLESYESSVIQEWWPDSRRGHRCGRARTAPVKTAASCDIRAI